MRTRPGSSGDEGPLAPGAGVVEDERARRSRRAPSSSTTAWAAMPSPRPIAPRPSVLVTFTLTRSAPRLRAAPRSRRASARGAGRAAAPAPRRWRRRCPRRSPRRPHPRRTLRERARRSRSPRRARVRRRKVTAEVALAQRAEQRAGDGVQQHVAVGVPLEAALVRDRRRRPAAAGARRPAGARRSPGRSSRAAASRPHPRLSQSLGRREILRPGDLQLSGSPSTTATATPSPRRAARRRCRAGPPRRPWPGPRAAARRGRPAASAPPSTRRAAGVSSTRPSRTRLMVSRTGTARIAAPLARRGLDHARSRPRAAPADAPRRAPPPTRRPAGSAARPARTESWRSAPPGTGAASFGSRRAAPPGAPQRSRSPPAITGTDPLDLRHRRQRGERVRAAAAGPPAGRRPWAAAAEALAAARRQDESRDAHDPRG